MKRGLIYFNPFFLFYILFINFFVYICLLLIYKSEQNDNTSRHLKSRNQNVGGSTTTRST